MLGGHSTISPSIDLELSSCLVYTRLDTTEFAANTALLHRVGGISY